jgi:hypothetical protein
MSEVIGIRVPRKLKKELQELNIDYSEEVRSCLEAIVKRKKLKQVMRQVDKFRNDQIKKAGVTTPSADIIREDREHTH